MRNLLTQNDELRPLNIHNFTLPAWATQLPDGRNINVCPQAGACAKLCYARTGTYQFPNVLTAHQQNLQLTLDYPNTFAATIHNELQKPRFQPTQQPHLPNLPRTHLHPHVQALLNTGAPIIRIHDSGDFHSAPYYNQWKQLAHHNPQALFYAYTKEVTMTKQHNQHNPPPPNFLLCYSLGGKQDHLLNLQEGGDQHADVFPTLEALENAGYYDQEEHDLLCVVAPTTRVGIVINNHPHIKKKLGEETFGTTELGIPRRRKHHNPNPSSTLLN